MMKPKYITLKENRQKAQNGRLYDEVWLYFS